MPRVASAKHPSRSDALAAQTISSQVEIGDGSDWSDNEDDSVMIDTAVGSGLSKPAALTDAAQDDTVMIDPNSLSLPTTSSNPAPQDPANPLSFPELSAKEQQGKITSQTRKIGIPPHRMTPLKRDWPKIYAPLVEECGLLVRMNVGKKAVELKTSKHTPAPANTILQRAIDFVSAFALGFSAEDAVALLRMEDIFVETFEIKDVKTLHGDHLSRAIGRIAGKDGKTRFTIENVSRTRIVLADQKIHILGTFSSIKIARDSICALILGSPPGKVFNGLRQVAARNKQRF